MHAFHNNHSLFHILIKLETYSRVRRYGITTQFFSQLDHFFNFPYTSLVSIQFAHSPCTCGTRQHPSQGYSLPRPTNTLATESSTPVLHLSGAIPPPPSTPTNAPPPPPPADPAPSLPTSPLVLPSPQPSHRIPTCHPPSNPHQHQPPESASWEVGLEVSTLPSN